MSVELDHAIVPSRDRKAAAELLASLLGVPWAESGVGPFCPVYVNEGLTLDFDQADGPFPVQHYCFRVSEAGFDGIVTRLRARGIEYRSTPHGQADMQVNTRHGGRIVYWNQPDGHVWEALTVSYARRPGTGTQGDAPPVDAPESLRRPDMRVKRIVAEIECSSPGDAQRFYGDVLGLELLIDLDWIRT